MASNEVIILAISLAILCLSFISLPILAYELWRLHRKISDLEAARIGTSPQEAEAKRNPRAGRQPPPKPPRPPRELHDMGTDEGRGKGKAHVNDAYEDQMDRIEETRGKSGQPGATTDQDRRNARLEGDRLDVPRARSLKAGGKPF